jgi:hypothetical protein
MLPKLLSITLPILFLLGSCQNEAPNEIEGACQERIAEAQGLHCRMLELHQQATALWDEANEQLGQSLPLSMPADERRNMLTVRNTGLIQMFEVYPTLDTAIHRLVEEAGRQDEALAAQMRAVKDSLDQNDEQIRALLSQLQERQPERFSHWKRQYDLLGCAESGNSGSKQHQQ